MEDWKEDDTKVKDVEACVLKLKESLVDKNTSQLVTATQELADYVKVLHESLISELSDSSLSFTSTKLQRLSHSLASIKTVFEFCRDVDADHGWAFSQFPSELGNIFKSNVNVLKYCFEHLESLELEGENDFSVLKVLLGVCDQVVHLDIGLLLRTWKCTLKMLQKFNHSSNLSSSPQEIDILSYVEKMVFAFMLTLQKCLDKASSPNQEFQRLLKACKQLLACVLAFLRDIDDGSCDTLPFYKLLLKLLHSVPPAPGAPPLNDTALQSIHVSLLSVLEPLLAILIQREQFSKHLLDSTVPDESEGYGWCMCLIKVMTIFDKVPMAIQEECYLDAQSRAETCTERCMVLEGVFKCVETCFAEMQLPILLHSTSYHQSCNGPVSLYQHVGIVMCSFIVKLDAKHFHKIEYTLMKYLFHGDPNCSQLAADVWSFLLRWGVPDFCKHYAYLFTDMLLGFSDNMNHVISHSVASQVNRAVKFMADKHKVQYISDYNPAEVKHLRLWATLVLEHFHKELLNPIIIKLTVLSLRSVQHVVQQNHEDYIEMHDSLRILCQVYSSTNLHQSVSPQHHKELLDVVLHTWQWVLRLYDINKCAISQMIIGSLSELSAQLVHSFEAFLFVKILSYLSHVCHSSECVSVLVSAAMILEKCQFFQSPKELEEQFSVLMINLFHLLLSHSNWLVKERGLEAFRTFAQGTPYDQLVERCIPAHMNEQVVDFLNEIPYHCSKDTTKMSDINVVNGLRRGYKKFKELSAMTSNEDNHVNVNNETADLTDFNEEILHAMEVNTDCNPEEDKSYNEGVLMMQEGWGVVKQHWNNRDHKDIEQLYKEMTLLVEEQSKVSF